VPPEEGLRDLRGTGDEFSPVGHTAMITSSHDLALDEDPPTKVSLLEVFVWFPTSEIMVLWQQALQVGTRVSPKWGSYRGESNRI